MFDIRGLEKSSPLFLAILHIAIIEQMFYIIFIATEEVHRGMAFYSLWPKPHN